MDLFESHCMKAVQEPYSKFPYAFNDLGVYKELVYNLDMERVINEFLENKSHGHSCLRISNYIDNEYMSNLYKPTVDIGYSDIVDVVIFLSIGIFPHLRIPPTKFIGYSDIVVIVIICP